MKLRKIIPFIVTDSKVWAGKAVLDADGYHELAAEMAPDTYIIEMELVEYGTIENGQVFVPFDKDGCYPWDEVDTYLLKDGDIAYYLTGNEDSPMGVDRNTYDIAWQVNEFNPISDGC